MIKTNFIDYEIMSKSVNGKLQVAIPREGLSERLLQPSWSQEGTTLVVRYGEYEDNFEKIPDFIFGSLNDSGLLYIIDVDHQVVSSIPKANV